MLDSKASPFGCLSVHAGPRKFLTDDWFGNDKRQTMVISFY